MNLRNCMNKLYLMTLAKINPVRYAKKIGVHMGEDVHIYGSAYKMFGTEPWAITLGNHIHITDEVRFINHDGGTLLFRNQVPDLEITKRIDVGDSVYIGVRALIMPGVHIGNRVIIGAGAVVTKDIPDNSVAVGVPARVIKTADEYFEKTQKESLHVGHLCYEEKDNALRRILNEV